MSRTINAFESGRFGQWTRALAGVVLVAAAILPFVTASTFLVRLFMTAFIWTGFAVSWNMFSGYSGYISFGHSIFFGLGAFTSTLLLVNHDVSPWIGMFAGGLCAAVAALVIGHVTLDHLSGIYFSLAMFTIPMAIIPVFLWLGYVEISIPFQPGREFYMSYRGVRGYYFIALGLLVVTVAVARTVKRSQFGRYLTAIRDNERAAKALGIDTYRYKMGAFSVSAFFSALFGTLFAQTQFILYPEQVFGLHTLALPIIFSIAGGLGTVVGPVFGGLTLYPISNYLQTNFSSALPGIDLIFYGVIIVVVVTYMPDGIYPALKERLVDAETDD